MLVTKEPVLATLNLHVHEQTVSSWIFSVIQLFFNYIRWTWNKAQNRHCYNSLHTIWRKCLHVL